MQEVVFSGGTDIADAPMDLPEYLHLRKGIYYFKRKIPASAAGAFPNAKVQVWKSLGTSEFARARSALADEIRAFDRAVAEAKTGAVAERAGINALKNRPDGTTKYLLEAHIPALLERFEHAYLSTDDEERQALKGCEDIEQALTERLECFRQGLQQLYRSSAVADYAAWEEVAQDLLTAERLIAPPNSHVRQELLRQLMTKDIEILRNQVERLTGQGKLTARHIPVAPRDLVTLRSLFVVWKRKQTRIRTIDTYETVVAEFEALHGAIPIIAIEQSHVEAYRDWLHHASLMRQTAKNRFGALATLVRYGQDIHLSKSTSNPFEKVSLDAFPVSSPSQSRRPYETRELNALFQSKMYTEGFRARGQTHEILYWAPLLGPFVGARIEEIAQLEVNDVECVNGNWCLRITDMEPYQKIKSESSRRRVPIHLELVKCGFLAYVARQKLDGKRMVFPSVQNQNKYLVWSNALSKRFGAYLDEIGLSDPRLDYHSFRYSFRQQCTVCGIEDEVRDALSGHWLTTGDSGRTYLRGSDTQYPLQALVNAIQRLSYGDVSLDHLYVEDALENVEAVLGR